MEIGIVPSLSIVPIANKSNVAKRKKKNRKKRRSRKLVKKDQQSHTFGTGKRNVFGGSKDYSTPYGDLPPYVSHHRDEERSGESPRIIRSRMTAMHTHVQLTVPQKDAVVDSMTISALLTPNGATPLIPKRPPRVVCSSSTSSSPRLQVHAKRRRQAPTVIGLQKKGAEERPNNSYIHVYPTLLHNSKWRQEQLNQQRRNQQSIPTSKSLGNSAASNTNRYQPILRISHANSDAALHLLAPKEVERRSKKVRARPMSAVAKNRKLRLERNTYQRKLQQIYKFDDWMQKYVVPSKVCVRR
jgi:hypothetical protein